MVKYEQYTSNMNKDKSYHFIYQGPGKHNSKLNFSVKLISDFNNSENQNYESFDNLFHSHKDDIISDINRLKDIDYYKRTGLKRKKGYMFCGLPGTGKTATVMAMSNYDKRHIIEVPLNRVKTNNELEAILNLTSINNINFNPDNIIILFDELDIGTKLNRNETKLEPIYSTSDKKNTRRHRQDSSDDDVLDLKKDKLSLGTLLSRLDGIGNYAGLIVVATTNNIDNIDKALYREGRLNLIEFKNASSNDIENIIKKYYSSDLILSEKNKSKISQLDNRISHAKIRCKLEYYKCPNKLLDYLLKSVTNNDKYLTKKNKSKYKNNLTNNDSDLMSDSDSDSKSDIKSDTE